MGSWEDKSRSVYRPLIDGIFHPPGRSDAPGNVWLMVPEVPVRPRDKQLGFHLRVQGSQPNPPRHHRPRGKRASKDPSCTWGRIPPTWGSQEEKPVPVGSL